MSGHRAGFVNIIGLPNVGKSTLLNALIGEKLSIVTPKAQTTRQRILGIVNGENYQVIFSDTPGFINEPAYKLQVAMNSEVNEALIDADALLLVTDKFQKEEDEQKLVRIMQQATVPGIIIINKLDLCSKNEAAKLIAKWQVKLPQHKVLALSSISKINSKGIVEMIADLLPESPPYYEKDELTDRNTRFYVAEIVREKIFLNYNKEVPYSCQVEVDSYKEGEALDRIQCSIYVERETQKAILIGNKGAALKKLGTDSRIAIQDFLGKKVHLDLVVKVKDSWRSNDAHLARFGYRKGD